MALPALASTEGPSELAALVRRYFAELDAFTAFAKDRTDEEADAFAAATHEKTMTEMIGDRNDWRPSAYPRRSPCGINLAR